VYGELGISYREYKIVYGELGILLIKHCLENGIDIRLDYMSYI
jgi:hypothetical protein